MVKLSTEDMWKLISLSFDLLLITPKYCSNACYSASCGKNSDQEFFLLILFRMSELLQEQHRIETSAEK